VLNVNTQYKIDNDGDSSTSIPTEHSEDYLGNEEDLTLMKAVEFAKALHRQSLLKSTHLINGTF
jgi:hypothetical protein